MQSLRLFVAAALGSALILALGYAATLWSVYGQLETAAQVVSNKAVKGDRLDMARPAVRPAEPKLSRHIQILESGRTVVTIVDEAGRVVYRGDPAAGQTEVTRDVTFPAGLRPGGSSWDVAEPERERRPAATRDVSVQ